MDSMGIVMLSRAQFGATASLHIIFPCLIIGLVFYLVALEILWLATGREIYRTQFDFWVKLFAAAFIVGVATGVALSFQLDTAFGGFYDKTFALLVPIRKMELLNAVFIEAGFFGAMVWGRERVGKRLHLAATLLVALGVVTSMACILARNSWMHTPDGFSLLGGRLETRDWLSLVLSPSFPYRFFHMLGASFSSAAFVVLGVSAWLMLKGREPHFAAFGLRASLRVIAVVLPLQFLSGDLHGLNTSAYQPTKLAAIEALWDTTHGAPMVLFALPDQERERNRYAIEIPKLASLIVAHSLNGKIAGLKEVPKDERPYVPLVFFSFRIMVAMGVMMLAVGIVGMVLLRKKRLYDSRRFLRICCGMIPSGFIATIAGWCVSEAGRQPWVIHGLLKTVDVAVSMPAARAMHTAAWFGVAYAVLFAAFFYGACRMVKQVPVGSA
ncbi:cytochrome bd ubiquinol oxidase subunit I [Janthinobacterium sp. CG_23.3]|uniref:cytochrome ubiquinol oxidase subunit I n=1 Tax=Janthinobacterium sp. CG_23.3 TaxID=3349634 RepID=UPI0038D41150